MARRWHFALLGLCAIGIAGACSLVVDTGNLDTMTDGGVMADTSMPPVDGGPDTQPLDSGVDADAGGEAAVEAGGCPTLQGPQLVPVGDAGYCIDSTEVTRAQYDAFTQTSPSTANQPAACSWNSTFTPSQAAPGPSYPVSNVDWCDAFAYCKWAGKRMCGAIGGGSLALSSSTNPNASQWYRACSQAGTRIYPYGNSYTMACNGPETNAVEAPIKTFSGCEGGYAGLFDMAGNVEEWQDSCSGTAGATDDCRDQAGTFGYPGGDPTNGTKCAFLDTDQRSAQLDDVGIRCCWP